MEQVCYVDSAARTLLLSYSILYWYITDHNYALFKSASQKSTVNSQFAVKAVDGDLTTESQTTDNSAGGDEWWKVDLQKRILLRVVVVYVSTGNCCVEHDQTLVAGSAYNN